MNLTGPEIEAALEELKTAFPHLQDWQHEDLEEDGLGGYTLWARLVPQPHGSNPVPFFVTFERLENGWRGALTVGKPAGFWTEARYEDAWLLMTEPAPTLPEALRDLKAALDALFRGLGAG